MTLDAVHRGKLRTKWERFAERPIIGLSLIFLFVLILPAAHPLSPSTRFALDVINYLIWAVFIIDYLVRVYLSDHRWIYLRSHPIEFLIVAIPFFRPLRLLRLLPLSAYFVQRAKGTFENRLISFVAFAAIFISAPACVAIYQVERNANGATIKTFGDSLWWVFSTLTTVGYGDRYPVTTAGRIIAVFVMLSGISLVGLLTAAVAAIFIGSREQEDASDAVHVTLILERLNQIEAKIESLQTRIIE
ncbi:pH-gated potassium channel KcsA [mine drainage metagenome]|uniref:pH-gated potassium channel KcsA n=1 Tax=mine drainage metagenome TaxID=410659 RepID=A0A1J5PVQ9_9ZZZZ